MVIVRVRTNSVKPQGSVWLQTAYQVKPGLVTPVTDFWPKTPYFWLPNAPQISQHSHLCHKLILGPKQFLIIRKCLRLQRATLCLPVVCFSRELHNLLLPFLPSPLWKETNYKYPSNKIKSLYFSEKKFVSSVNNGEQKAGSRLASLQASSVLSVDV